jgi:hypothetical protein
MKSELNHQEKELYRRTDEILHYLWDPIGVSDTPQARDEYHGYLPRVFSHLLHNSSKSLIVEYLMEIESNSMGMGSNKKRNEQIADMLLEAKDWIMNETSYQA